MVVASLASTRKSERVGDYSRKSVAKVSLLCKQADMRLLKKRYDAFI
jgi:hypothetical protein